MDEPRFNLHIFVGHGAVPEHAAAAAEKQVRDYLSNRNWKDASGRSAYTTAIAFHADAHGYTCAITVLGPEDMTS